MLVDKPRTMDYFCEQIREYGEEWKVRKTTYDAERKGKWIPSMGKQGNPFLLEAPWLVASGYGIRVYLTAYALLAVIHDKVLPHCSSIAKGILPKELVNKIWHNLVTGSTLEDRAIIPDATYYPRTIINPLMIENYLGGVEVDIENHFAPKNTPRKVHPYYRFVDRDYIEQENDATQKLADSSNVASEQKKDEKTKSPPDGEWSKPMSKSKMMNALNIDSYKTFNAWAKDKEMKPAGNRQTFTIRLDVLDSATRQKLEKA